MLISLDLKLMRLKVIKGGAAGGSILKGVLKVNQLIEVRPGIVVKDENGNIKCTPIYSRIVSLYAEQYELQFAEPGGLIRVGTTMDPMLTRADRLVGQVLGEVGSLPDVYVELETRGTERQGKVSKLSKAEVLMLNIGSMSTGARVLAVKNDLAKLQLTSPVCTSRGEKIALSRRGTQQQTISPQSPGAIIRSLPCFQRTPPVIDSQKGLSYSQDFRILVNASLPSSTSDILLESLISDKLGLA
ncbi:hypothetical protein L2E82_29262 [Cichorium intybus]|uniref:Uncharacterized protein n=1 Tax=Cichorium intybus TaxID=13427 RepID=A0ACB9CXB0_CICIN|nr:hypothetical protein L2E82_29262 [Cichorium intybus]